MTELKRTALHDWHVAHGGRMVDFAGWELPVFYELGAIEEHHATRNSVGLFDIDHMGQFEVAGPEAGALIDRLLSSDPSGLADGEAKYGLFCNEQGTVIDDVIVYRMERDRWLVVVNAANRQGDFDWIGQNAADFDATLTDRSDVLAMIAVQGPKAVALIDSLVSIDLTQLERFTMTSTQLLGAEVLIARTGYTGEDGVELYIDGDVVDVWTGLFAHGAQIGIDVAAIGLGARDSLRFEPGYPLYGHELSTEINPFEARLKWAVDLADDAGNDRSFVGAEALRAISEVGITRRLEALTMIDKGVPREGSMVVDSDGNELGEVVSGMFAPTLDAFACQAFLPLGSAAVGTELSIDIRGRRKAAVVAKRPLYRLSPS